MWWNRSGCEATAYIALDSSRIMLQPLHPISPLLYIPPPLTFPPLPHPSPEKNRSQDLSISPRIDCREAMRKPTQENTITTCRPNVTPSRTHLQTTQTKLHTLILSSFNL